MIRLWAVIVFLAGPALGATCRDVVYKKTPYTICQAQRGQDDLRLFYQNAQGQPYGNFLNLLRDLELNDQTLVFGMNAGMYHPDLSPVGYYREIGKTYQSVVTSAGPGNFGMLPNGVFCIRPDAWEIIETLRFKSMSPDCSFATQSGPMLVIDGEFHPRLIPNSTSRYIRNGVGVSGDHAYFVISNKPVNFYDFASLFRDYLDTNMALYFDGNISRLYVLDPFRHDFGRPFGPMVGVVVAKP